MLSRSALGLLLMPSIALAASAVWPPALTLAIALAIGAAVALALDTFLAPRRTAFRVTRQHEATLMLGVENPIAIGIRYDGARPTRLIARDECPDLFVVDRQILDAGDTRGPDGESARRPAGPARLLPGATIELSYRAIPPRRGHFVFGAVVLRWQGPLKLVWRQAAFALDGAAQVYPNLTDIRKYDALARVGRTQELGLRRSRASGEGEFESLRDYQPDDQARHVDWRATARRGRVTVQQLQTERSQSILTLIDCGRLMEAPCGNNIARAGAMGRQIELQKIDAAIESALMLSYVAGQRGDRVGALAFADNIITHIAPRSGRAQFYRMLAALYAVQTRPVESDYSRAFGHVAALQRRRALIVVFTDLASGLAAQTLVTRLAPLRQRHLTLLVTLSDPSLLQIAREPPTSAGALHRIAAAQRVLDSRMQAIELLRQSGVLTLDVPADRLSISVVNRYLDLKARHVI